MTIGKKPKQPPAPHPERAAEHFIAAASKPPLNAPKIMVTLRFDPDLLSRIDGAAKRRGVSRSAWIQYNLSRLLEQDP